jgi:hypothetical protein
MRQSGSFKSLPMRVGKDLGMARRTHPILKPTLRSGLGLPHGGSRRAGSDQQMEKYLFQLCFDSHLRFASNLYFNYEDVDFKLVKGTKEQQDVLCTISEVQSSSGPAFGSVVETVYEKASRFLNCLSWEFALGSSTQWEEAVDGEKSTAGLNGSAGRYAPSSQEREEVFRCE